MADDMKIKKPASNSRGRVIAIVTIVLFIVMGFVGYYKFLSSSAIGPSGGTISGGPGSIRSIPGGINPTAQYAKLQEEQNVQKAQTAQKKGGSSIPTIVRSTAFGEGVEAVGPQQGKGPLGFSELARLNDLGPEKSLWIKDVKKDGCSPNSVKKAVGLGAGLSDLRSVCSCIQLKDDGYNLQDLKSVCSCPDLKKAGFNSTQLRQAGFNALKLSQCGFDACELRAAGFSAQALKDAGLSDGELKGAGFSNEAINQAGGIPAGMTDAEIRQAGCSPEALAKLRERGVSAAAIRRVSGCTPDQLRQAGYTAAELEKAGFTPAELSNAGFATSKLAGLNLAEGVSDAAIQDAGCDPAKLHSLMLKGVSAKKIEALNHCSALDLGAAGFSKDDLMNAGFTKNQADAAEAALNNLTDCSKKKLEAARAAGISVAAIENKLHCSVAALKSAGFTDTAINAAGVKALEALTNCSANELKKARAAGVSVEAIMKKLHCSAASLKAAGYSAANLLRAGFSPKELAAAGFSPEEIKSAEKEFPPHKEGAEKALPAKDCSPDALKAARARGVTVATIRKTMGCSLANLKAAGYTAKELAEGGFTAAELKNAGFSAKDLLAAGFSPADLKQAGFTASQLRNAGIDLQALRQAGYGASELMHAGYSAKDMRDAGFGADELKKAGFTPGQIQDAGFSDSELQKIGLNPKESALNKLLEQPKKEQLPTVPGIPTVNPNVLNAQAVANQKRLKDILAKQNQQMNLQQQNQLIQNRVSAMSSAANQMLQSWKGGFTQVYVSGGNKDKKGGKESNEKSSISQVLPKGSEVNEASSASSKEPIIRAGEVLFAVLDSTVDSDEPSPILATIVAGPFKGSKLIGSFNLPSNGTKLVITFNMLSVPGAPKTTSINAYAIDPNTARTALATTVNHHYLLRYGSLFAATWLEGFGNAVQSANTTITIGGTGVTQATTIQNGINRSTLENAVIGLATLGKSWGQVAMQNVNTPITVTVCGGTGIGVLFTQDVTVIT